VPLPPNFTLSKGQKAKLVVAAVAVNIVVGGSKSRVWQRVSKDSSSNFSSPPPTHSHTHSSTPTPPHHQPHTSSAATQQSYQTIHSKLPGRLPLCHSLLRCCIAPLLAFATGKLPVCLFTLLLFLPNSPPFSPLPLASCLFTCLLVCLLLCLPAFPSV
jgi:hypothetical protein